MRCLPGAFILFLALALIFLVSISVPYVVDFDVVRVLFSGSGAGGSTDVATTINQLRLGIWGYCARSVSNGSEECIHSGLAYLVELKGTNGATESVQKSWTRGLVMSPVATGFIFLAFVASFSAHLTVLLVASLLSFMGALVTVIFMAINIALYLDVKHKMEHLGVSENTNFGPGFWMSLAVLVLTLIAGFLVCFGRNRERNVRHADNYIANSNKPAPTAYGQPRTGFRRFLPARRY